MIEQLLKVLQTLLLYTDKILELLSKLKDKLAPKLYESVTSFKQIF